MATAADLRARVRLRLEEPAAAIWSDAEVDQAVLDGLAAWNAHARRERVATATLAGAGSWALPADCVAVVAVLLDGLTLPRRAGVGGGPDAGERQSWAPFAGELRFAEPASGSLEVWYHARYDLAALPADDEGIVVLGAAAALLRVRLVEAGKRGAAADVAPALAAIEAEREALWRARTRRARSVAAGEG